MINKKENESLFKKIAEAKKLIKDKKDKRIDYQQFGDKLLGSKNVYSPENIRKAFYILDKFLEDIPNDTEGQEDNILTKKLELEKEKIKYQDQKREYRNFLRQEARFDHLRDEINRAIKNNNITFNNNYYKSRNEKCNSATLILSDWHLGMQFSDILNTFDVDIAKNRIQTLLSKVIYYCNFHNIYELNIELLGDLIQGYIHVTSRVFNEEDVIEQTILCGELLANFINELAKEVPVINVYSCVGNHGRTTSNLKESLQSENFEKLITWYLQSAITCKNVNIKDCDIDIITYTNLNNINIVAVHGNLDKVDKIVDNYIKMYKKIPDEFHMGHLHFYQENDEYDINVVVNGTLSGTDQFAKKIRKTSIPCQVFRVYGDDICTYKIKL